MPPQLEQMMQQPTIDEVVQLLRNDSIRGFQIDIETDSTIEPDEDAEKQRRMEFVQMQEQMKEMASRFEAIEEGGKGRSRQAA
ncbi:hypothetical protein [Rhizobium leguminosarum]|uniref:hypothetical protein n=1 Tax=Rhizobium leguminosarum TaxID=384 RepID=UPI001441348C|nr:hypothetical protein [Rhizobium leguminosarum]NKL57259.1 hypothetical protein [Rhizobium leguminosarum bv. viciae]